MLNLTGEAWTWFAITCIFVLVRMISRRLLLGSFKKLQIDDWLMLVALATDTVLIASMVIVSKTSSNLIDPEDTSPLTPENVKNREYGSKMVLVVEQMQIMTIWLAKGCLLLMYHRLTMSLRQNLAVKIVAGYVVVGFVVMEILYFGVWCRPFNQYWAVPPNNDQCSAATHHLITNAVINVTSDIMIILIPMPIFLQSTLTVKKKAILCGVFAVGTFTILAAILNKFYSFSEPFGSDWTFWYIRESSTALIAANLPMTWTLLQRVFRLNSFKDRYTNSRTRHTSRFRSTTYGRRSNAHHTLGSSSVITRGTSQERINHDYSNGLGVPLKIYQKHEVQITTVAANETQRGSSQDSNSIPDGLRSEMTTTTEVKGGRQVNSHFGETASEASISGSPQSPHVV